MKKDTGWVIAGIIFAVGAGYLAYKKFVKPVPVFDEEQKQKQSNNLSAATPPFASTSSTGGILGTLGGIIPSIASTISSFVSDWNNYVVNTQSTPLNVRQKPDSNSKVIGSLAKGTIVMAKASGVKDWMAISKDGKNTVGYVSSSFLVAKP